MARAIKLVFYAVNGSGTGHLTRLAAIARWVRRYAAHARSPAEIVFLTTSEADGALFREKFASFKMPSKTAAAEGGLDKLAYLALAKQWVWHSLALLRPDVFVVDTFPRGSFGELLSALDLCSKRVFVYRPTKPEFAERADFQAMLPLYDSIVVPDAPPEPDAPGAPDAPRVPAAVRHRVRHVGPVLAREACELAPRAEARARLGLGADDLAVYVTAGGGGDPDAERHVRAAIDAVAALGPAARARVFVGAGALYRGARDHARATWLDESETRDAARAFDFAIAAAGYNTFHELMAAGVPTVFVPQPKIADDQATRAARAVAAGAAVACGAGDAEGLARAVAGFADRAAREAAGARALELVRESGAREAAAEILSLVLPPEAVRAAQVALTDAVLASAREIGVSIESVLRLAQQLELGPAPIAPVASTEADGGCDAAVRALGRARAAGVELELALRLGESLLRKLPAAPARERGDALGEVLAGLGAFGDAPAAVALLKLLVPERELGAAAFAELFGAFLARARARGDSLYAAVVAASRAQSTGGEGAGNAGLLKSALANLDAPGAKDTSDAWRPLVERVERVDRVDEPADHGAAREDPSW